VKVFAVGNTFCGDDGLGAAVLATLRGESPPAADRSVDGLQLIDLGTDALALIDELEPGGHCVVVDAARMGLEPGQVAAFTPDQARLRIRGDGLSLHGLGLAEAFALAEKLGRLPARTLVIGVEPAQVVPGTGLSDAAAAAVPRVVEIIRAEVLGHE
jgi:hydrogenase maturation protease